jgi:hypothetical protein
MIEKVCKGLLVLSYFSNLSFLNDLRLYAHHNLSWISLFCCSFFQDNGVISLSPYPFLDYSLNFLVLIECLLIVESLIE